MERRAINPTPWLQHFNINHGVEVKGAARTLYLSGQTASAPDGAPMHPGDLGAQFHAAWANLKAALADAQMRPKNIVRLNIYVTDVPRFMTESGPLVAVFAEEGLQICCTLLGVAALYDPQILIELEATAAA
jgi:enamine deaminase RidA (YjgF/YER057c/UK114 family)